MVMQFKLFLLALMLKGQVVIEKAETQNYQIDFGKEIKVDADKNYYFVLRAENNDYVQWNYNLALKASAYSLSGDNWR